ncbi:hypothetical protein [Amycolatopsis suaedae]|uniref:Secreted protein n=1 Tax=Amycolatopsis suaedae TaxID=2510978 RepID=A0A4Q7J243_9PSEU|nr:hypothetical protein [Amycolatopsis suaedae]RZQ60949.1 hypothetical protein EWH70_26030 [Amycolatopsis suaedae]
MPTWLVVLIVIVAIVVVAAVGWLVLRELRRKRLREKFGPEYDRAVHEHDDPRAAHKDLSEREKRHSELDIKPLPPSARERYTQRWALIQETFVDRPSSALAEADRVLVELMAERGYPTDGYEQQAADLSVEHSRTLENYRRAHDTLRGQQRTETSTEQLREAMVQYRTVFEDLLTDDGGKDRQRTGR